MRSLSGIRYGIALLVLLLVPTVQAVYAEEAPNPGDPPEARIKPPGGIASQARISPPGGAPSTDARIRPPGGVTPADPQTRIEPGVFEQFLDWLVLQAGIKPPIG